MAVPAAMSDRVLAALCCSRCASPLLRGADVCCACGVTFDLDDGVLRMLPEEATADTGAEFYSEHDPLRYGREGDDMPEQFAAPVRAFVASLAADALVVEIGAGRGAFAGIHPGYVATDFSLFALKRFGSGPRIQADATRLPFGNATVDAFFSIATLEHVPEPARALEEIDRCLRPGGRALLYPAWYVRPWASRALHVRPYAGLGWRDRLGKALIPVRDSKPFWFAKVLPGRVLREFRLRTGRAVAFRPWRLEPNMDEYLVADSDAFTSLDPQAVSAFFVARGYRDLNRPGPGGRIGYGYEPVVVEKASGSNGPGPA